MQDSEATTQSDRYQYPRVNGPTTADVVRACEEGDRVAFCLGNLGGDIKWHREYVSAAGEEWVEFGNWRLEVVEDDELARYCKGDDGVRVESSVALRTNDHMPDATGIERTPADALEAETWYEWEVCLSETRSFEEASTDQSMLVDAPTKELAIETAKRHAEMENGYAMAHYRQDEIEVSA